MLGLSTLSCLRLDNIRLLEQARGLEQASWRVFIKNKRSENTIRPLNKPGLVNRNRLLDKLELPNSLRPADGITKHQQVTTWTPKGPQSGCQGRVSGKRQFRAQIKEGNVTQTRPHTDSKTVPEQPQNDPRTPTFGPAAGARAGCVGVVWGSFGIVLGLLADCFWVSLVG